MTRPALRLLWASAMAAALALAAPASAADLGVRGATWPVAEPDLLAQIEARLAGDGTLGRTGAAGERSPGTREATAGGPRSPARHCAGQGRNGAACSIPPSSSNATSVRRKAFSSPPPARGVNPLERVALARDLLFVDGRREAEVAWALARENGSVRPAKIVLLAGRPLELARRHGRPFFFDQGGRLAARFGLRFTPSLVAQAGTRLRITEIPLDEAVATAPAAGSAASPGTRRGE